MFNQDLEIIKTCASVILSYRDMIGESVNIEELHLLSTRISKMIELADDFGLLEKLNEVLEGVFEREHKLN